MSIVINPGSGSVMGATYENAIANIIVFAKEVGAIAWEGSDNGRGGRWTFVLRKGEKTAEIKMPGLPLDAVRYINAPGENIWHFPRLYVDGSSWVWEFAARVCFQDKVDE